MIVYNIFNDFKCLIVFFFLQFPIRVRILLLVLNIQYNYLTVFGICLLSCVLLLMIEYHCAYFMAAIMTLRIISSSLQELYWKVIVIMIEDETFRKGEGFLYET